MEKQKQEILNELYGTKIKRQNLLDRTSDSEGVIFYVQNQLLMDIENTRDDMEEKTALLDKTINESIETSKALTDTL